MLCAGSESHFRSLVSSEHSPKQNNKRATARAEGVNDSRADGGGVAAPCKVGLSQETEIVPLPKPPTRKRYHGVNHFD